MKKRIDSAYIDNAIEEIAGSAIGADKQLEQYLLLLPKAKKLSYKKGIAVVNKMITGILLRRRKFEEAELYLNEGLKIAEGLKERDELYFQLRLQLCEMMAVKGNHNETVEGATELLSTYAEKMKPETFIRCYLAAGNGYWMQNSLYNAMYMFQKVLQRREELSDVPAYNQVWTAYASVLVDLLLYDKARDEMNEILKHAQLSPRDAMFLNIQLSNLYAGLLDHENSRKYIDECYHLLELHPLPEVKYSTDINWVCNLATMGRYAEALPMAIDTEKMQPEAHVARDSAEWKYMVSICLLETGKPDEALPWIKENEKIAIENGLQRQKIFCYDNYFLYNSLKGNTEEARKYHRLYKDARDEDNRMTHDLQVKQMEALINLERKEHELQVEKLKNQQVEQEANHARQQNALMQANIEQRNKLIDEFQTAIKRLELSDARRKDIFKGLHDKINTVKLSHAKLNDYDTKFNPLHQERIKLIQDKYPSVTPAEAKIAVMLASGLSNKEIAAITLTTNRNVETQRFNLRKKLKLKTGQDLLLTIQEVLRS